jgi:predicted O-linked N-acetylglucosamine transferase (SPINDLY family)
MATEAFLSSVKDLAERNLTLVELITAAEKLQSAGAPGLAAQLYALWIRLNENHPQLPAAYYNHAALLTNSGDPAGAKRDLERALALNPDFFPAYIGLGNALESLGAVGESLAQWSALATRLGAVGKTAIDYKLTALKQMGRILGASRRPVEAEAVLRESLELDPGQADVAKQIVAETGGRGVDCAMDCAAKEGTTNLAIRVSRNAGRVVLTGIHSSVTVPFEVSPMRRKELAILNVRRSNHETEAARQLLIGHAELFAPLVTHTRPLDRIGEAFEITAAYSDGVGKMVVA